VTTYLGYDELKARLTAGTWSSISEPEYEDWEKSQQENMNTLRIRVNPGNAKPVTGGGKDRIITTFTIRATAPNKTNADLYLEEIRSLLNVKVTGGDMRVIRWFKFFESTDMFIWQIEGRERLYDF
jgi:hypothetical protein